MNKNQEQKDNKKIILLIIITIILIPFSILVYINNKPKEKEENKNNNPFYEEKIIIDENHSGDNLSNKEDNDTIKENLPSDGEQIKDTIQEIRITNSYCDKDLKPINSIYNKYIYYNTIEDNCAMISNENSKYISEYTTKAYNKAISLKSKWEDAYIKSKDDETGTFAYGKYTIKNKNGNILGFTVTLTYNTSIYVLDKNDNWVLIKK